MKLFMARKGVEKYQTPKCWLNTLDLATSNAKVLTQHFGLSNIKDNWMPGDELPEDTLALTNVENVPGVLDFYEVQAAMAGSLVSA